MQKLDSPAKRASSLRANGACRDTVEIQSIASRGADTHPHRPRSAAAIA